MKHQDLTIGSRVYFDDPEDSFACGPGTVTTIHHEPGEDDPVLTVNMDSGGDLKVFAEQLRPIVPRRPILPSEAVRRLEDIRDVLQDEEGTDIELQSCADAVQSISACLDDGLDPLPVPEGVVEFKGRNGYAVLAGTDVTHLSDGGVIVSFYSKRMGDAAPMNLTGPQDVLVHLLLSLADRVMAGRKV